MKAADKYTLKRVEATVAKNGMKPFDGETVLAYINHGRWVADCPCNGAELVAPNTPMLCGSCGAQHKVRFPRDRSKIVEALKDRPVANQNWQPGETVDQLMAENIDNGLWEA